MMNKQIVVLEIEWDGEFGCADASQWDWSELVDENVTVLAAGPVVADR